MKLSSICPAIAVVLMTSVALAQQDPLDFGIPRHNPERKEGRDKVLHDAHLHLLSALINPGGLASFGNECAARFAWPGNPANLYLHPETVPDSGYRLQADQLKRNGTAGWFRWPTAAVIKPMRLNPADIGGFVLVGPDRDADEVMCEPICLDSGDSDVTVNTYRFTFVSANSGQMTGFLNHTETDQHNKPITRKVPPVSRSVSPGVPVSLPIAVPTKWKDGPCSLRVTFNYDNDPISASRVLKFQFVRTLPMLPGNSR